MQKVLSLSHTVLEYLNVRYDLKTVNLHGFLYVTAFWCLLSFPFTEARPLRVCYDVLTILLKNETPSIAKKFTYEGNSKPFE